MFEHVILEDDQITLLCVLVEAARNVRREERQPFIFAEYIGDSRIQHPGLPDTRGKAYKGDIEELIRTGLISASYQHNIISFDVSPKGFKYYESIKQKITEPIQRIEHHVQTYLDTDHFQKSYPQAFQKWVQAETLLWSSDTTSQFTTIGHLCREAVQEFATSLVEKFKPHVVDPDKAHTVARLRAVFQTLKQALGKTEAPFFDALLTYWGTVNDLIQRQEHGGQREKQALSWHDARRTVFQTAIIMFEIDSSLSLM